MLAVHNAGPPIPESALSDVFEPTVRNVQDPEKMSTGLGLGLYIAKELVTAHGGAIDVTSTDASGTTFTVRLPRHAVEATRKGTPIRPASETPKRERENAHATSGAR